jgi:hypothetical protein
MFKKIAFSLAVLSFAFLMVGCYEDELGVYTLCSYEAGWKGPVCVSPAYDPYQDFWNLMTSGADPNGASLSRSRRYLNSEVTIPAIIPVPGRSQKCWDEFDLVFFYGHNNTIVPPHPHDWFGYSNYVGGAWVHNSGYLDDIGWGHLTPYDYYPTRPIVNANVYPAAVTYLYNEYTSCLLGGPYDYGGGNRPWQQRWNDAVQYFSYGELGDLDMEWLILYGCQAVITANEDGTYNNLALRHFCPISGRYHIIMGHYISYSTSSMKPLADFANDLMSGVPIQCAYFDTDPDHNTSALAAERNPFPGWPASTMVNDRWRSPVADNPNASVFTMRWILPLSLSATSPVPSVLPNSLHAPTDPDRPAQKFKILSQEVRQALKQDAVRIRQPKEEFRPAAEWPVLVLEPADESRYQKEFEAAAGSFLWARNEEGTIKKSGGLLKLRTNTASGWASRASGSFKLTDTRDPMVAPAKIRDVNEAVQKALQYLCENRLVEMGDGEEMDILFVSTVKNARASVRQTAGRTTGPDLKGAEEIESDKLEEEFNSDTYVGFGRRFNGVPIVGSRLVFRLDGNGKVAMIHKNWRKIVGIQERKEVIDVVTLQGLRELIAGHPEVCAASKERKPLLAEDIHLVNVEWGYMEAPSSYSQPSFRPGAVVLFKIGKQGEGTSQLVVSLTRNVGLDNLWGRFAAKR